MSQIWCLSFQLKDRNLYLQDCAGAGEGSGDRPGCRWQASQGVRAAGARPGGLPGAAKPCLVSAPLHHLRIGGRNRKQRSSLAVRRSCLSLLGGASLSDRLRIFGMVELFESLSQVQLHALSARESSCKYTGGCHGALQLVTSACVNIICTFLHVCWLLACCAIGIM